MAHLHHEPLGTMVEVDNIWKFPIEISKLCRELAILDLGSSLNDTAHCRPTLV